MASLKSVNSIRVCVPLLLFMLYVDLKSQDLCWECNGSNYRGLIEKLEQESYDEAVKSIGNSGPLYRSWFNSVCDSSCFNNVLSGFCLYRLSYPQLDRKAYVLIDLSSPKAFRLGGWTLKDNADVDELLLNYSSLAYPDSVYVFLAKTIYQYYYEYDKTLIIVDNSNYDKYWIYNNCLQLPRIMRRDYDIQHQSLQPSHIEVIFSAIKPLSGEPDRYTHDVVSVRIYSEGKFDIHSIELE